MARFSDVMTVANTASAAPGEAWPVQARGEDRDESKYRFSARSPTQPGSCLTAGVVHRPAQKSASASAGHRAAS